ncbi:MAG: hypothetical protein MJE63_01520 [Proteobacteria bacterium]|nr:hypothetical protein [Pseudomonadota bacterium]
MTKSSLSNKINFLPNAPQPVPEEITEKDRLYFNQVITTDLNAEQIERILQVKESYPLETSVVGIHWHPEHIPIDLITKRISKMFPNKQNELVIPTQHNVITDLNGYSGVEVDCYSQGFNQKVQLLLHFESSKVEDAHTLKKMLAHTFKYRSSQLFEFIKTIDSPVEERLLSAAAETGANSTLVDFVRAYVSKIKKLLEDDFENVPKASIKNKLLRNFFDCLRADHDEVLIDRAQNFLTAVKKTVKESFPLQYFYRTSEIIEEARSIGAGIVIPHPEQFWPVLLADYDVDGIEVWNPQSQRYTDFLVSIINKKNRESQYQKRKLLVFMGDDTHFGEKIKDPSQQNPDKANREVGVQPSWDDLSIQKNLIKGNFSKEQVIEDYKSRLA